jgi:hypothetical protein
MSERKIEKSYLLIDGKKVPYLKVPPGMSGLTAEAKEALELKTGTVEDETLEPMDKDPQLEEDLERYLNNSAMDDYEVEEYLYTTNASPEIESLFDKIED